TRTDGTQTEAAPPSLRLPGGVAPTGYRVELALDPEKTDFTGHVEIAVTIEQPTSLVWLNGHQLQIDRARLTTAGGDEVALEALPQAESFIGFRAAATVPAGPATIVIDYRGKVDAVDTYGIFHQQDRGRWYLYTQFEATAARRAFPCFDEPGYKVPWQLTLEVPADQVALANTPIASEASTDRGTRRVTFEQTPPMPSYLVAFAVGPFEVVEAGTTRAGVPIRIVSTQGRGAEAAWAVRSTARLVGLLEDYFGSPYPYAKLDSIAIPLTVNFGAMENVGLITYSERLLLTRPEDTTVATQRRYAWVAAHELAHQWFGNLVTPAWWNDIWLNEAFATWMERDVIQAFEPAWDAAAASARDMSWAMWSDSLDSARQINQPIVTHDDIDSAFDSITYEKGAAVIRMFEHWVGPDTFRTGVRAYLKQYAWKNATSGEFLDAIGAAAGKDVKTPFSTFLDQVGTPLVSMDVRCDEGAPPVLALTQRRYLPIGSRAAADQVWQVPVCVEYLAAGKPGARACTLLTEASGEMPLDYCPAWVAPNADAIGYYRSKLGGDLLPALLRSGFGQLSLGEKINVVADVRALVASGDLPPAIQLDLARRVGGEKSRFLVDGAAGILTGVEDDVPAELDARYSAFVADVFGKRARALGWTPRRGESLDAGEIRETIVPLVADQGRDRALAAEAVRLARAWLTDRKAVTPRMRDAVLRVAARHGDAALFDAFWAEAIATGSQPDRRALLTALGSFRDPALTSRALAAVLGDALDIRESLALLWTPLGDRDRRQLAFDFVEQHFDALVARMPGEASSRLARVAAPQCDPALRARVEALLARVAKLPSGPRAAAQSLERFELCLARRAVLAPALATYFRGR
ncbi:MAG TPA: M1 family aminopeptidase, partial [Kofleriaceae bacterium]|nr:M1 family aminopeptidase [Kofleriaceae bacterium]